MSLALDYSLRKVVLSDNDVKGDSESCSAGFGGSVDEGEIFVGKPLVRSAMAA